MILVRSQSCEYIYQTAKILGRLDQMVEPIFLYVQTFQLLLILMNYKFLVPYMACLQCLRRANFFRYQLKERIFSLIKKNIYRHYCPV